MNAHISSVFSSRYRLGFVAGLLLVAAGVAQACLAFAPTGVDTPETAVQKVESAFRASQPSTLRAVAVVPETIPSNFPEFASWYHVRYAHAVRSTLAEQLRYELKRPVETGWIWHETLVPRSERVELVMLAHLERVEAAIPSLARQAFPLLAGATEAQAVRAKEHYADVFWSQIPADTLDYLLKPARDKDLRVELSEPLSSESSES